VKRVHEPRSHGFAQDEAPHEPAPARFRNETGVLSGERAQGRSEMVSFRPHVVEEPRSEDHVQDRVRDGRDEEAPSERRAVLSGTEGGRGVPLREQRPHR